MTVRLEQSTGLLLALVFATATACGRVGAGEPRQPAPELPVVSGEWQTLLTKDQIACPEINRGQVVDHCFFRDAAGTWQAWVQVRDTKKGRVFTRWEQEGALTDAPWTYRGVHWTGQPKFGESQTVIQAPHVYYENGRYWAFYGGGGQISMARSADGVAFMRHRNADGHSSLFSDLRDTTPSGIRDPFVARFGGRYHLYYTSESNVLVRTTDELDGAAWSEPAVAASERNRTQCPFVVHRNGWYYLFMMGASNEFKTNVLVSRDPTDFGNGLSQKIAVLPVSACEIIRADGRDYISSLIPGHKGVRVARLRWELPREPPIDGTPEDP